jgi:YbbR domain-containing protein
MRKVFKGIYNFFDNHIIMPISRLVYYTQKKIRKSRGWLDKLINKPNFLLLLSLGIAILCFTLTDSKVISLAENQAEVISNVPVVVKYNQEAYVVEGVPSTIDITITGRKSDIYLAKQLGEYEVVLDLTDYTASDTPYKVYFTYTKSIDSLSYKLDPSYVSVMIKNKVSDVSTLSYDLLNIDKLDSKLSVKSVSLNKTEVVVKGSESSLEKIASVKALIDLNKEKFTTAGTFDISDVPLVAYDNNGQILDNIDIVPNTVSASVTLESYSANVPLKVESTGSLIAGKAIASISINNNSTYNLTIYGEKSDIDSITSVPVTINVDGLGKDASKTYNVSLTKPNGVRYMSAKTVTIAVTFGNEEQKTVDIGNKITQKNLGDGLVANIISNDAVTVQVKGVASVINDITDSNINAYVDLDGLSVGEHEVEVKIDNDNPLVNYVVSSRIKINITNKQ